MKKTLQEQRAKYLAEMKAISDAAKLGNRGFTPDERARLEVLKTDDNKAKEQFAALEADEKLQAGIDAELAAAAAPLPRKTDADAKIPATPRTTVKLANGHEVTQEWVDDPKKGFRDHRDFLRSVMLAARGHVDARLRPLTGMQQLTAGSDEAGTYSDPYGGVLVPKGFSPNFLSIRPDSDPMGAFTTKVPMDSPTVGMPARTDKNHSTSVSGGLRVYRRSETQAVAGSRMEMESVELKAAALFGVAYATEELLSRSLISFLALLEAGFSDEFGAKLTQERLTGNGVGEFEGVMNSPCLITVDKESGQAADTIQFENVVKMRSRSWGYGSSIWLAGHDSLPQLMLMNQAVGTGGVPVWQPSGREDHPDMLLGRPLFFSEFADKIGDLGDLVLGNWSQYLEGTLTPMQNAESMHVRFLEHERTFKFWTENAGRVWWRSPLTPKNGQATLSPFVTLQAR